MRGLQECQKKHVCRRWLPETAVILKQLVSSPHDSEDVLENMLANKVFWLGQNHRAGVLFKCILHNTGYSL